MKTYIILHIILFGLISNLSAQQDSIELSQGFINWQDQKYDRIYKLFIEDRDREINHLWKVDLVQLSLRTPNLSIEQRMGKSFSSISGVRFDLKSTINEPEFAYGLRVKQSFRWYHNLQRRERLGKSYNGFSGNYFSINTFYHRDKDILTYFDEEIIRMDFKQEYMGLGIAYGIQRRIGNIGYIGLTAEWYGGFNTWIEADGERFNKNLFLLSPRPELRLEAGFAIDSFKNLKRMLR